MTIAPVKKAIEYEDYDERSMAHPSSLMLKKSASTTDRGA